MSPLSALLWRQLRVHQVYGANTDVGKTIVSTILCSAASKGYRDERTSYLKPVSTGPDSDADSSCESPSTTHCQLPPYLTPFQMFSCPFRCSPY
jgi:dethiobiotin synthetase